jgi:hypothetical protein
MTQGLWTAKAVYEAHVADLDEESGNWGAALVRFPKTRFRMQSVVNAETLSQQWSVSKSEDVYKAQPVSEAAVIHQP